MKKKLCFFLIATVLLCVLPVSAYDAQSETRADLLYGLGLFQGMYEDENGAPVYALERTPTRLQGLIMLIRLLGEETAAESYTGESPFTDVPDWGARYASYAADKGYTQGTGGTAFSPDRTLDAKSYVTFVLRALGYDDSAGDFAWETAPADAAGLGLMDSASAKALASAAFYRGDMVDISYCALTMPLKGASSTLAQRLVSGGVFTAKQGTAAGVIGKRAVYTYTAPPKAAVTYEHRNVSIASGGVSADIVTVDLSDPRVTVKAGIAGGAVGADEPFSSIVKASGALAVTNGNFFQNIGNNVMMPIGHLMIDGAFVYGVSGLTAFGITEDNKVVVGRPSVFFRVACTDSEKSWSCYELNSETQADYNSVLYTPAYGGGTLRITRAGKIVVVEGGAVTAWRGCSAGETLAIPKTGFILWMGTEYTSTSYFKTPAVGDRVTYEPYLFKADEEGFTLDGVVTMISGAPRLVQDGRIVTELEPGFTEARFTTVSSSRTAVGVKPDGNLLLVSVASATIQQMRELMLILGCEDAVNLDGGASCAMAYDGEIIRSPGRELTCTVQVFVD